MPRTAESLPKAIRTPGVRVEMRCTKAAWTRGQHPCLYTNPTCLPSFPMRYRQVPAYMEKQGGTEAMEMTLTFLMQNPISGERKWHKEGVSSFGEGFPSLLNKHLFVFFGHSFRKWRSLMNMTWHWECSSPKTKKKKRVIGKIKDWQESNWAQPAQVGKSQGLIVTNLITF